MVDVTTMPAQAFGHVPTPAVVAPIEFTLPLRDYALLGGHMDRIRPLETVVAEQHPRAVCLPSGTQFPVP
jgi:hypothetical protein